MSLDRLRHLLCVLWLLGLAACVASVQLPPDWPQKGHFFARDTAGAGSYLCGVAAGPARPAPAEIADARALLELLRYFSRSVASDSAGANVAVDGALPGKIVGRESRAGTRYAVACVELAALRVDVESGRATITGLSKEELLAAVDAAAAGMQRDAPSP